jgi:hypothetical protein
MRLMSWHRGSIKFRNGIFLLIGWVGYAGRDKAKMGNFTKSILNEVLEMIHLRRVELYLWGY